jgi:transposase
MRCSTKYVGLDVHQATTSATVRDSSGKIIARSVLPTEESELLEFFAGMRGAVHVALEEGTQAQWLYDLLSPRVSRVLVCDRRGEPRHGNKSDQVDSAGLAELLRCGQLRTVYHGRADRRVLKELTHTYDNLVEDSVRAMLRMKALFRARAIRTSGGELYAPESRGSWLDRLPDRGSRFRADTLAAELDLMRELRQKAKAAMIAAARQDPAYALLSTLPCFGPVRVSQLLAAMQTPWRFRTKRNLWAYAGLAVVTHSSGDYTFVAGRPVRRRRQPMTRGLNKNHNRVLKNVFKGAANAAVARPGPLKDFYDAMVARGMREELARVTLARKLAAVALRLWKKGEPYDASKLTLQAA